MKALFGVPTTSIMIALLALLGAALITVAWIAIRNRTMFRMGIRNLPRRGTQTVLVVFGLMLSTLIVTAAFVTGDTIDHSLTTGAYDLMQRSDLDITWNGERDFDRDAGASTAQEQSYIDVAVVPLLEAQFAGDPEIEGFLPALYGRLPATNQASGLSSPAVQLAGFDPARLTALGGLRLVGGGQADLLALGTNEVLLSRRAASDLDGATGDTLTLVTPAGAREFRVAGIVEDELASGVLGLLYTTVPGGVAMRLDTLQDLLRLERGQISALTVALRGDVRTSLELSDSAGARIEAYLQSEGAAVFEQQGGLEAGRQVQIVAAKQDLVEEGEATGNLFTTFFLVLGLFSMAAGIMLIFTIFVMLAAERRAEMGMARAVGAQSGQLVQSFVAEGMAYSLLAGVAGAALGVVASIGLTNGLLPLVGGDYFSIVEAKVTAKSIVMGYSLGVVITFVTVVIAAMKVTHVNIVAAIRGLPEEKRREGRRSTRWGWVIAGIALLPALPLGLWFLLRKGLGLPWAWVAGPLGILAGMALLGLGQSSGQLAFFSLGISLVPLSVAALARHLGAPARPTWSITGLLLLAYWLLPVQQHDQLFGEFERKIDMFVVSGVMIVVAATLVIVFNARLLVRLFAGSGGAAPYRVSILLALLTAGAVATGIALGDRGNGLGELTFLVAGLLAPTAALAWAAVRYPQLAPALKMAIAYPLANRFRTGMTVAMFSLILFSLTVFSVLLANFGAIEGGDNARGNLDIVTTVGPENGQPDLVSRLQAAGAAEAGEVAAAGAVTIYTGTQEVRVVGASAWQAYPVLAASNAFLGPLEPRLDSRARGYQSDQAALEAVRDDPSLALIDLVGSGQGFNDSFDWSAEVTAEAGLFDPFEVEVRNTLTGATSTVTVVGVLRTNLPSSFIAGVYVNADAYRATFGEPRFQREYLRLNEGANARAVARGIESTLATQGVEADSIQKIMDDRQGQNIAFNRMFQSFMALGLLVGIAGLGVISFRAVVERRQQIGMLRAIGYQRGTVALTFLLESSFVAAMGILSGVVGGTILARNLLTSTSFTEGATVQFTIPWDEVTVILAASFAFSLLMTWWPSRGAARVPVAEALRYE